MARSLAPRRGVVVEFDGDRALGTVRDDDGHDYRFHAIELADGSRTVEVGVGVVFRPLHRFGEVQAGDIVKTADAGDNAGI